MTTLTRQTFLTAGAAALAACATRRDAADAVTIVAEVPPDAGTVYLTGNLPALGPWKADALAMTGTGRERVARLAIPDGARFEFKVTLGSWEREGLGPSGMVMPNSVLEVSSTTRYARIAVTDFRKDSRALLADPSGSGILGKLDVWLDVAHPDLPHARHVTIWTPPGYDPTADRRYPVLYMHDGQNLFDPRIANTGVDWGADEAMMRLAAAGSGPAIVVGVWSTPHRWSEYAPAAVIERLPKALRDETIAEVPPHRLLSDAYVSFLADALKPRIDAAYRTRPEPEHTWLAGSSMGGLISLYGLSRRKDVFGRAAALSIHWPITTNRTRIIEGAETWRPQAIEAMRAFLFEEGPDPKRQRIWIDHGDQTLDAAYAPYSATLFETFPKRGFDARSFQGLIYPGTEHNEAAWRARLAEPFAFLLAP